MPVGCGVRQDIVEGVEAAVYGHAVPQGPGAIADDAKDIWQHEDSAAHCHMLLSADMSMAGADYLTDAFRFAGGAGGAAFSDTFNLKEEMGEDNGIAMHCIDDIAPEQPEDSTCEEDAWWLGL